MVKNKNIDYTLCVVISDVQRLNYSHLDVARDAVEGGATLIQFREKNKNIQELIRIGLALKAITKRAEIPLIVNDFIDVALAIEADGVHLGQDDMPLVVARHILHPDMIIGVSVDNPKEAMEAEKDGADYLGVGPVFATLSKKDAGKPIGYQTINAIKKKVKIPVLGIGGINILNLEEVIKAGADGVAVISAVSNSENPKQTVRDLVEEIKRLKEQL